MDRNFVLETTRIVLRPLVEADAAFILALQSEEGWKRFIGDRGVHDLQTARGYAKESGRALLEHAACELGIREVLAIASPDNHASVYVLAKLGFREQESRVLDGETDPARVLSRVNRESDP